MVNFWKMWGKLWGFRGRNLGWFSEMFLSRCENVKRRLIVDLQDLLIVISDRGFGGVGGVVGGGGVLAFGAFLTP